MTTHKIDLDLQRNGHGTITLDGTDISAFVAAGSVSVLNPIGEQPKVYITLAGRGAAVRVLGGLVAEMPVDFRELLVAAGWSPPPAPGAPRHAKPVPGHADEVRRLQAQCSHRRIWPRPGQMLADALGERMDQHIADAVSAQMKLEGKLPLARTTFVYNRFGRVVEKETRLP